MLKLEDLVHDMDKSFLNGLRNTVKAPEIKEPFSLEKLMKSYKALDAEVQAWKKSDNYMGTRPEEGRLLTIGGVECLIWLNPSVINEFYIRLAYPSQFESKNRQRYQSIIAELDRQRVVAKRYG